MAEEIRRKKIAICEIGINKHDYPSKGIREGLEKLGHTVITYIGTEREDSLLRSRHFQVYEGFIAYCEKHEVDIAFIDTVVCPEHLLAELKVKKDDFKPRFMFLSNLREPARSLARANLFKELIENKFVSKVLVWSLLGTETELPKFWKDLNIDKNKFQLIGEPLITEIYEEEDIPLIEDLQIPKDKKVGLFFGRDEPSKGLDYIAKALDLINEDIHILIVAHNSNFTYTEERAFEIEKKNTSVIYRKIGNNEIRSIYDKSDFAILPYKKPYEYGGSGILKIAVDFNKPAIVPDLYPFNKLVDMFKIGITFKTEDYIDLAESINSLSGNLEEIKEKADFNGAENLLSTYDEIAEMIVKD